MNNEVSQWKTCSVYTGGGVNYEFLSYCWSYYNEQDGLYPIKGLTLDAMAKACALVEAADSDWCEGDTDDRLSACHVLLHQNPELKNPYLEGES